MKVLITGASGLVGTKLVPLLKTRNHDLICYEGDIRDVEALRSFITNGHWDAVIHLAAMSHIPTCEKNPRSAYEVNTGGTFALLDALKIHAKPLRIIFASTAQVYSVPKNNGNLDTHPISEDDAIEPQTLYARTKWAAETALRDPVLRGQHSAIILRLFNHSHKSQASEFFIPHAYNTLNSGKPGEKVELKVGNIDIFRDFGSVFDLLRAFVTVLEAPHKISSNAIEAYNVCSGTPKNLRKIILALAARLKVEPILVTDPHWVRRNEPTLTCGSYQKLQRDFGWTPHCENEEQLADEFLRD